MSEVNKQEIRERLGNIDRIRDLLFGEKIEDYEEQFQNCHNRIDKLESKLQQFEQEIHDRLTSIEDSLSAEIRSGFDSLEQKVKYLDLSNREKSNKLKQEISFLEEKTANSLAKIEQNIKLKNNLVKQEIERVERDANSLFQALKQQIRLEIKKDFLELKEDKISRLDLTEVLFELCLKLRGDELLTRSIPREKDNYFSKLSPENYSNSQELNEQNDRQTA